MAGRGNPPGVRRGGRKVGTPNKVTADIKALAQVYGPAAIERLAQLSGLTPGLVGAESEATQLGAMRELLDRGYGKPAQAITAAINGALQIQTIRRVIVDPRSATDERNPDD